MQTAGRLCRTHIRPLFLPATYIASRTAPPPPQTPTKIFYDYAGTFFTTLILNYLAAPFMLQSARESLIAWNRLWWYGHCIIFGLLFFFYLGGAKFLGRIQANRQKAAGVLKPSGTKSPNTSGSSTPTLVKTLPPVDEVAREMEKAANLHRD